MAARIADILMLCLRGWMGCQQEDFLSPPQAYEVLKKISGQDFGCDMEAWETWVAANRGRVNRQGQDIMGAMCRGLGRGSRNR